MIQSKKRLHLPCTYGGNRHFKRPLSLSLPAQDPDHRRRRAGRLPAAPTHEPANRPDAAGFVQRRPPPAQPATPGVVNPTRAGTPDPVTETPAAP